MMPKNEPSTSDQYDYEFLPSLPPQEIKPINFHRICSELFSKGSIIGAVVCRIHGGIVYISSNWNVEPSDLAQCIKKWQDQEQFITLQGHKYALLLNTKEYFSGTNYKDESFLIGARSPKTVKIYDYDKVIHTIRKTQDGFYPNDDRYYVIGYAPHGANGRNAYVDVVQAANQMKEDPEAPRSGACFSEKIVKKMLFRKDCKENE
jgi:hypothetical protein